MNKPSSVATKRFLDALNYAVVLHGNDVRKSTSVPYVAHLFGVCALVLLDGGTEDEAAAALLHDALEDHPQETSREIISNRFGTNSWPLSKPVRTRQPITKGVLNHPGDSGKPHICSRRKSP